ncbi:hypothetical protein BuS5_04026 (plasmid) [Desulfosarcina sp. BuS5]|uniref:lytic transglycosylase domain-containing protein n=1 Tax=Desulfosarcina sp. BuS5 TaxID=933262 RepID=UPI00068823BF|nr:lytic transglycosylase domain-containing protein [Desulfosarcina sp. BuS5]WDN91054.1 hypothetical protein BuS5_04026 [Desulfosarcina sp. BuS5]
MPIKIILLILLTTPYAPYARAFCFDQAGEKYDIPPALLRAIATVESSLDPQAVNYNKNGSYDFGLMQINTCWQETLGDYWNNLADPCCNVIVGAWILRQCFDRYGYSWDSVACYNTGKPASRIKGRKKERALLYIKKIQRAAGGDK